MPSSSTGVWTSQAVIAAIGAAAGQMHGARHEIGNVFGTHRRTLDPADAVGFVFCRGFRSYREGNAVHHALFAIAHRAHRAARKATDAAVKMVAPEVPAFGGSLRFETGQRGERLCQLASGLVLAEHCVVFLGERYAAFQATVCHHLAGRQTFLAFRSDKYEIVTVESSV